MIKKILIYFIVLFASILFLLSIINIYKLISNLLYPDKIVSIFGYTDYVVVEDHLGDYSKGDLAIIKLDERFNDKDYVLYSFNNNIFFGQINGSNSNKYEINKMLVYKDDIFGKSIYKVNNFEKIYMIITNPYVIIVVFLGTIVYFSLLFKERIKRK